MNKRFSKWANLTMQQRLVNMKWRNGGCAIIDKKIPIRHNCQSVQDFKLVGGKDVKLVRLSGKDFTFLNEESMPGRGLLVGEEKFNSADIYLVSEVKFAAAWLCLNWNVSKCLTTRPALSVFWRAGGKIIMTKAVKNLMSQLWHLKAAWSLASSVIKKVGWCPGLSWQNNLHTHTQQPGLLLRTKWISGAR